MRAHLFPELQPGTDVEWAVHRYALVLNSLQSRLQQNLVLAVILEEGYQKARVYRGVKTLQVFDDLLFRTAIEIRGDHMGDFPFHWICSRLIANVVFGSIGVLQPL